MRLVGSAVAGVVASSLALTVPGSVAPPGSAPLRIAAYRVPLHFEANHGQANPAVAFSARGRGYRLDLSPDGVSLALEGDRLTLRLVGARPAPAIEPRQPLP